MNTWVQLKDGIAFASVQSVGFIENAILLDDNFSWDQIKGKKYENGQWVEPQLIRFVEILEDGIILKINSTVFSSDASEYIIDESVKVGWILQNDGSFVAPEAPLVLTSVPVSEPAQIVPGPEELAAQNELPVPQEESAQNTQE
jgi:hypothetical protein